MHSAIRASLRAAAALVVACSALTGAAQDAPPGGAEKAPAAPAKLLLRPAADATYFYRFTEKVHATSEVASRTKESTTDQKSEATWDVELRMVETRGDGNLVLEVKPTALRGWYESETVKRSEFSHDRAGSGSAAIVGVAVQVTVTPTGRIVSVADTAPVDAGAAERHGADVCRRTAVERFLQEVPGVVPRAGVSWESERLAAPDMVGSGVHMIGLLAEKATVRRVAPDLVTASIAGKGGQKVKKHKPTDPLPDDPRKWPKGEQIESWTVTGELSIRPDTGLPQSRTTKVTVKQHNDMRALRGNPLVMDTVEEFETRLELVREE